MLAGLVLQHDGDDRRKGQRTRILAQYLDDGAEADPDAIFRSTIHWSSGE